MSAVLEVQGLVAGYAGVPVLHGVDLRVQSREVVALLGANGAGKTTSLLTISGLVRADGGTIEVLGEPLVVGRRRAAAVWRQARRGVAHVPEDRGLFFDLTVAEHLRLARSGPRRGADAVSPVPDAQLHEWFPPLAGVWDRRVGLLSGGEQQMVALARAVVARPKLLLVDELSLGLAPIIVEGLLPVLRTIATETGAGVLVVEQHVPLVLDIADRAYVMVRGQIAHEGPADVLAARADLLEASYLGGDPAP